MFSDVSKNITFIVFFVDICRGGITWKRCLGIYNNKEVSISSRVFVIEWVTMECYVTNVQGVIIYFGPSCSPRSRRISRGKDEKSYYF